MSSVVPSPFAPYHMTLRYVTEKENGGGGGGGEKKKGGSWGERNCKGLSSPPCARGIAHCAGLRAGASARGLLLANALLLLRVLSSLSYQLAHCGPVRMAGRAGAPTAEAAVKSAERRNPRMLGLSFWMGNTLPVVVQVFCRDMGKNMDGKASTTLQQLPTIGPPQ